jgi:coiled-coil domain-containing protein 22
MEEVDAIILQSLREIGCDIDNEAKLKSLTPEEIFKCLRNLCKSIQSDVDIPSHLPAQMAQRFSAASRIVDCCKSLGFQGDLGYQTILYSNVIELRRIFMWLIEHLPKSEDKTDAVLSRNENKSKLITNKISAKLGVELREPWKLEFLQKNNSIKCENPTFLELPKISKGKLFPYHFE